MAELRARRGGGESDGGPVRAGKEREHVDNVVRNGPLHGTLLVVGPLVRLAACVWFLNGLAGGNGPDTFWRTAPLGLAALTNAVLQLAMGRVPSGDPQDPVRAEILIYSGVCLARLCVVYAWWTWSLVPEASLDGMSPLSLVISVLGGGLCAVIFIVLPKKLFWDEVLQYPNPPPSLLKSRSNQQWNPYLAFGAGSSRRLPNFVCHMLVLGRALNSTLVVPVVDEVFYRSNEPPVNQVHSSFLYRRLAQAMGAATAFTDLPVGLVHIPAAVIAVLLSSAQYIKFRFDWVSGLLLGIMTQGLLMATGHLGPSILLHAVANLGLAVWVPTRKEWYLW